MRPLHAYARHVVALQSYYDCLARTVPVGWTCHCR